MRALLAFVLVFLLWILNTAARAQEPKNYEFDPRFLRQFEGMNQMDLSQFNKTAGFLAGSYDVQLVLNEQHFGNIRARFAINPQKPQQVPQLCLSKTLLDALNIDPKKLTPNQKQQFKTARENIGNACIFFDEAIDFGQYIYAHNDFKLSILIDQNHQKSPDAIQHYPRANAAFARYSLSASAQRTGQSAQKNASLGLGVGALLKQFYLQHDGHFYHNAQQQDYQNHETFAGTLLGAGHINLLAGNLYSRQHYHDNFKINGVVLLDERPQLGWAPLVKGVAHSFAKVRILQNGTVIYQTNVAAGEFVIDDLSPAYSGNLEVEITEANGSVQRFWIFNRYNQALLRPKNLTWQLAAGTLESAPKPAVLAASLGYGLNNFMSLYGGANLTADYFSAKIGSNIGSILGATAVDFTLHQSADFYQKKPKTTRQTGGKWALWHHVYFADGKTDLNANVQYFLPRAYMGMQAFYAQAGQNNQPLLAQYQLGINQNLSAHWGSIYAHYGHSQYRHGNSQNNHGLSYQNGYRNLSYALGWQQNGDNQNLYANLNISWGSSHNISSQHGISKNGSYLNYRNGVTGSKQAAMDVNYQINHDHSAQNNSLNAQINARGSGGNLNASASKNGQYQNLSASASGALVYHTGGVNFVDYLNTPFAIVHAPNAAGSRINASKIAKNDYAIVSGLSPWTNNALLLQPDPNNINLEYDYSSTGIYPSSHSANLVRFATRLKVALLFQLQYIQADGSRAYIPFGAQAEDAKTGAPLGFVIEGGRLLLNSELHRDYQIKVTWQQHSCQFQFNNQQMSDLQIIGKLCTQ